jgi:cytochrome c
VSPKTKVKTKILVGAFAGATILFFSALSYAEDAAAVKTIKVDAVAAQRLARKESCFRCHHVSKKKEGPSYQSVAYKYRGDASATDKIIAHITSGTDRVKLSDGHTEDHKMARTKDMDQIRNLVAWILSQ